MKIYGKTGRCSPGQEHECSFFVRRPNSRQNHLLKIVAIHGGYLLFAADAGSLLFLRPEHVQCHMSRCGQYLRRISPVDRALVLFHGDIQYPMQLVFDAPVTAHRVGELLFG